MSMFDDIPVGIGIIYEGERIRGKDMQVELGGPREAYKYELVQARKMDEIEDGVVKIIGKDIPELDVGQNHPLGILIEVAGKEIEKDLEGVIERRMHEYVNFIEGFMHLNQRYDIQLRLSKKSYEKGFNSFKVLGIVLMRLYKSEMPFIEKIQLCFITDPEKVKEGYEDAMKIYDMRDARARGMNDDDVEVFYGCSLCQSFAPTHLCVITPQRYANCGAISWFDGRAAYKLDPEGPVQEVKKGECLDPIRGEYKGCNELGAVKSMGAYNRVYLHSAFEHPHTSCGCFQAIWFYIPEVDAFGIVHRDFVGPTVVGVPFSTMAADTSGGRQVEGFLGIALEYLRSPKFLYADGGLRRLVWMPKEIKERYKEAIPADVYDKIATEEDAKNIDELMAFLDKVGHPWVKGEVELPV